MRDFHISSSPSTLSFWARLCGQNCYSDGLLHPLYTRSVVEVDMQYFIAMGSNALKPPPFPPCSHENPNIGTLTRPIEGYKTIANVYDAWPITLGGPPALERMRNS